MRREVRCPSCRYEEQPCAACRQKQERRARRNARSRAHRRALADAMNFIGVRRVRGSLGGLYWE